MNDNASPLTLKQRLFVKEYLIDRNATRAYMAAYGSTWRTANVSASRVMKHPSVRALIDSEPVSVKVIDRDPQTRAETILDITKEMVIQRYWDIANADPNDLIQYKRTCCRHCWGNNHRYQWRDEREYNDACLAQKPDKDGKMPDPPPLIGGYGYNPNKDPNPKCPECDGDGFAYVHANDTRKLTGSAKRLYAGVKKTKEGFEIKMHDPMEALNKIARLQGYFEKDNQQKAVTFNVLKQMFTVSQLEEC